MPSADRGAICGASESLGRFARHRIRLANQDQLTHLGLEILSLPAGLRPGQRPEDEKSTLVARAQMTKQACRARGAPGAAWLRRACLPDPTDRRAKLMQPT